MIGPKFYAWDRNGKPLAGGKLYTYQARTNTPKVTYQSEDQEVENTNPVILNGEGYANVYLDGSYKMVLKDSKDSEIWSSDPVTSAQANEWTNCFAATYVGPSAFKVAGNQTDIYLEGRTLRINNNAAEYKYAQVESAVYAGSETSVVVNDAVITTGLDSVCTSVISINAHNDTYKRNDPGAHDIIYRRATTKSEVESGVFVVGSRLELTDRGNAPFDVTSGGSVNGVTTIDAGNGNTAKLVSVGGEVNSTWLGVNQGEDISIAIELAASMVSVSKINILQNYLFSNTCTLPSNIEIDGKNAGIFIMDPDLESIAIQGSSVDNVKISNLSLSTTQEEPIGGNQRFIQFNSSKRIRIENLNLYNCKNQAIVLDNCQHSKVSSISSERSYGTVITLRNNCSLCEVSNCSLEKNGYLTDEITGVFGRGFLVWESNNISVSNMDIKESSEYGFRVYSENGDTLPCENIAISNVNIEDAEKICFYIFNASGLISNITINNLNVKAGVADSRAVALEGDRITLVGGNLESKLPQQLTAIALNNGRDITVDNVNIKDFANVLSYGQSVPAQNATISKINAVDILRVSSGIIGDGHTIKDSEFLFDDSASMFALGLGDGESTIDNNLFDGAYRVLEFSDSPSKITNNKSKNTKNLSVRKYGTSLAGMTMHSNSWDIASNPAEFGRISELNCHGENDHCVLVTNAIPTVLTYPLRSIAYCNVHASLTSHIGWVQTSLGVWNTFGAITP